MSVYVVLEEQVVDLEYVNDDNGPDQMRPVYGRVPVAVFELKEDAERCFSGMGADYTIREVQFVGWDERSRREMTDAEREALARLYGDEWTDEELLEMQEDSGATTEKVVRWLEGRCLPECACYGCTVDRLQAKKAAFQARRPLPPEVGCTRSKTACTRLLGGCWLRYPSKRNLRLRFVHPLRSRPTNWNPEVPNKKKWK